jgi:hypothetical protein
MTQKLNSMGLIVETGVLSSAGRMAGRRERLQCDGGILPRWERRRQPQDWEWRGNVTAL